MKRKVISILLAGVMAAGMLAGCGSETSTSNASSTATSASASTSNSSSSKETVTATSTTASSTEAVSKDQLPAGGRDVTLSMMVTTRPTTNSKDFILDYIPELVEEKYPNIHIEVEQLPTDQYKQTIRLKFASGEGPDFFTWWPQKQAEDLVENGYVKDMSDFPLLDKFNQDIVNDYTYDGKTYGVPLGTSFLTTWYNKDAFKDAGIEAVPTNWDEFIDDCQKLKDAGYTPITCGDKQSFVIQFAMYQIGASEIYADNPDFDSELYTGKTKFTDQCWVDTVTKLAELYQKGFVIDNSLGLSQDQSRQAFVDGQAAMIFDGSFGYDALNKDGAKSFEKGMFPIPSNDKGGKFVYNLTPSNAIFVSNNMDEDKQEAVEAVLEYWFTEGTPLFEKYTEMSKDVPCYEGVEDHRDLIKDYLATYKDDQSVYNLNNAWPEGVSDAMCTEFQNVITGDSTPEKVCQVMQDKFDELNK